MDDVDFGIISIQAVDLLKKMLNANSEERISAFECLKHEWIENCNEEINEDLKLETLSNLKNFRGRLKM